MEITFYVPESDNDPEMVIPVAMGRTMLECANQVIWDNVPKKYMDGRMGHMISFVAFREIVADRDVNDIPLITLDQGVLDIEDGWAYFTPMFAIPTNTDVYDN